MPIQMIESQINKSHLAEVAKERFGDLVKAVNDQRWKQRLKALTRTRELLCDILYGENQFGAFLKDLDRYFYYFAYSACMNK